LNSKAKRIWPEFALKKSYDFVIIGGGVHGLAAAYFLARDHGITNVAVLERRYLGFGGSGRNTSIVRANQRSKSMIPLHMESLALWPGLMAELDFNMLFFNCGCLTICSSPEALNSLRQSASVQQYLGTDSRLIDAKECKELIPELDISDRPFYPVLGGLYHPPGGTLRHDAVVWGLAKGAANLGVHIHQSIETKDILVEKGRVAGVDTDRGFIRTRGVLNATGGYSPLIAAMVDLKLPLEVLIMQAMVSQPLKPFLNVMFVSNEHHVFASQSLRGEIIAGAWMDPWPSYCNETSSHYIKHEAAGLVDLLPCLKAAKFMRHWAGICDMTPDMAPIMDGNNPVRGYYMDVGWGFFGFKTGPIAGRKMAQFMAAGEPPEIIAPFSFRRFERHELVSETPLPILYGPVN
jgi:sarcosine oxidase subunit beta